MPHFADCRHIARFRLEDPQFLTPSDQVAKFTGTQDVTVRVPRDLAGGKYRQTISLRKVSGKLPASVEVWKSVTRHRSRPG